LEVLEAAKLNQRDKTTFNRVIAAIKSNKQADIENQKNQLQKWAENANNQAKPISRQLKQAIESLT
jgi:formiminotetrahydrofolate cyclodeaminase